VKSARRAEDSVHLRIGQRNRLSSTSALTSSLSLQTVGISPPKFVKTVFYARPPTSPYLAPFLAGVNFHTRAEFLFLLATAALSQA